MLEKLIAPLHRDGIKFVAIAAIATILCFILWAPLGWIVLVLTAWVVYFFRDPERVTPTRAGLVISPADGIALSIGPAPAPSELAMDAGERTRIGVLLNIFDVHVVRAPVAGRVASVSYVKGRFLNASLDKASLYNERLAIRLTPPDGPDIGFVLIAGLVARRIVCSLYEGQQLAAGERVGIIRFGSRVDGYCDPSYVPMAIAGQRMVGGETVLADRAATELARRGIAQ